MKPIQRCAVCRFYEPNSLQKGAGACHRYPPQGGEFQPVAGNHWCGEWQAAIGPPVVEHVAPAVTHADPSVSAQTDNPDVTQADPVPASPYDAGKFRGKFSRRPRR